MEWDDCFFIASSLPNALRAGVEKVLDMIRDAGKTPPDNMFPSEEDPGWYVLDFGGTAFIIKSYKEIDFITCEGERVEMQ